MPAFDADALYRKYAPSVFRVCRRFVGNDADADDLTQAAFIRILDGAAEFRGDSAMFTWIYRIAVNESLQFLRREKGRRAMPLDDESLHPSDDGGGGLHLRLTLRQVLDRLPDEIQETAVLHYMEGFSQEETAAAAGISLRTVEYRLADFRARARKLMEERI